MTCTVRCYAGLEEGHMLPDWIDKVVTGGPAFIFAALWWLERTDRRSEREEHKTVSKEMIAVMHKCENTLETLGRIFNGNRM